MEHASSSLLLPQHQMLLPQLLYHGAVDDASASLGKSAASFGAASASLGAVSASVGIASASLGAASSSIGWVGVVAFGVTMHYFYSLCRLNPKVFGSSLKAKNMMYKVIR